MTERILHAGLHKTGSTYLQGFVFPVLEGVRYLPSIDLGRGRLLEPDDERPILMSSENACGYPYPLATEFSPDRLLSNVRLLGVDKVILFDRDHHSWLLSLWFQTLNEGKSWSLARFIEENARALATWISAPEKIATALEQDDVQLLSLSHSSLRNEHDETLKAICRFIGASESNLPQPVKANRSRKGKLTSTTYRLLNRAHQSFLFGVFFRATRLTPRHLIQGRRSPLGYLTETLSSSKWSAKDVQRLL